MDRRGVAGHRPRRSAWAEDWCCAFVGRPSNSEAHGAIATLPHRPAPAHRPLVVHQEAPIVQGHLPVFQKIVQNGQHVPLRLFDSVQDQSAACNPWTPALDREGGAVQGDGDGDTVGVGAGREENCSAGGGGYTEAHFPNPPPPPWPP